MFSLNSTLDEIGVSIENFSTSVGISVEQINEVIKSGDSEQQFLLYEKYVELENDKYLFIELSAYFEEFIDEKESFQELLNKILFYKENLIARRMILMVHNILELVDDIEKIRPGNDGLKIFFYVVCIESLFESAFGTLKKSGVEMVINFFQNYISGDDRVYILEKVKRSLADELYDPFEKDLETAQQYKERMAQNKLYTNGFDNQDINIEIFARIITEIRNTFAHQGIYYGFSFSDTDYPMINSIDICEKYSKKNNVKYERIYDIGLSYSDFKTICINGFIHFICKYLNEHIS